MKKKIGLLAALVALVVPLLASVGATSADASSAPMVIGNDATHRCLDDSLDKGLRTNAVCDINGRNPHQVWTPSGMGNGAYEFRNRSTGRCINYDYDGLHAYGCQAAGSRYAAHQSFAIRGFSGQPSAIWQLRNTWSAKCLDDASSAGRLVMVTCMPASTPGWSHNAWDTWVA